MSEKEIKSIEGFEPKIVFICDRIESVDRASFQEVGAENLVAKSADYTPLI